MKATQHLTAAELMVGDWIMYGDKPVQVLQLTADKEYKEFSVIPITPEILEKNGWHKFQMYYRLGIDKQQYMEYYPHLGRLQRIYKHKDNKEEVVFTCGALSYVHLLQHALKLCGISKEIVI